MKPTDDLVREFHELPGSEQAVADYPSIPSDELLRHRLRLIEEEFKEVKEVLVDLLYNPRTEDKLELLGSLLKEMCDLRYVLDGTAVSLGLPYEDAYRAVHASNMSKVWPDGRLRVNGNGKVLKPPGYRPPNMERFVCVTEVEAVDEPA
jgi:predicted HAD superfamily Cof-like phosphohydrolase